eukprot:scaffold67525_cov62-Phaeocystis_antarctica.AAC.2
MERGKPTLGHTSVNHTPLRCRVQRAARTPSAAISHRRLAARTAARRLTRSAAYRRPARPRRPAHADYAEISKGCRPPPGPGCLRWGWGATFPRLVRVRVGVKARARIRARVWGRFWVGLGLPTNEKPPNTYSLPLTTVEAWLARYSLKLANVVQNDARSVPVEVTASHVNLAVQDGRSVRRPGSRHRRHLLPAVGRRVVHVHAVRGYKFPIAARNLAAQHVDLPVDDRCGVRAAGHGQARHPSPRTRDWVVSFDCVACVGQVFVMVRELRISAVVTADRVDLARYRRGRQVPARRRHAWQRIPAVGLRVVHFRFSNRHVLSVITISGSTHDVEPAAQSRSAVSEALRGHAVDLAPRIVVRVVGQHGADISITIDPAQVDQAQPETQAGQRLQTTDGHHCIEQHALSLDREQRWPRANGVA